MLFKVKFKNVPIRLKLGGGKPKHGWIVKPVLFKVMFKVKIKNAPIRLKLGGGKSKHGWIKNNLFVLTT